MSENTRKFEYRRRLEAAKFFYEQMKSNFQDRTRFRYLLDAFLALSRSVTHVFKEEFHDNKPLMDWYNSKVEEMKGNTIMRFLIKMRNISLKVHTPDMQTTAEISRSINVIIGQPSEKHKKEEETVPKGPKVVSYSFVELPRWFDENPDVMSLCKKYLDELERFVTEAENVLKEKEKEGVEP